MHLTLSCLLIKYKIQICRKMVHVLAFFYLGEFEYPHGIGHIAPNVWPIARRPIKNNFLRPALE